MTLHRQALVAIVCATLGFIAGRVGDRSPVHPPPVVSRPAPPTRASTSADALLPPTPAPSGSIPPPAPSAAPAVDDVALLQRAREGDLPALKALEAREPRDRTIEEAIALETGHAELARKEARQLLDDLAADRALFRDPATMAHAYRLALDPAVAPTLLAGLVAQRDVVVPDFLFDLVARGEPGARLVLLAEDLLLGAARRDASPELEVILQARAARTCERTAALLPSITERADDRVLPILLGLDVRTGCGPKRADDCHACLREPARAKELEAAREAAAGRPFVAPWAPSPTRSPQGRGSAQQRKPVE